MPTLEAPETGPDSGSIFLVPLFTLSRLASKPGSESIRRVSVWSSCLHPKIKLETFLVGFKAYKLELKASHMLLRGLHGLHPKNEARGLSGGL